MSTGICICSACRREVHQWGPPVGGGWVHCSTRRPICDGATAIYPASDDDVQGTACCADGPLPSGRYPPTGATASVPVRRRPMIRFSRGSFKRV